MSDPLVVLGLGNPLAGDDGVGVRVIELLRTRTLPPDIHVLDGGVGGMDWYDLVTSDAEAVWLVDAVKRDGAAPGTRIVIENLAPHWCRAAPAVGGHDLTVAHAVRLAAALDQPTVPLRLYGIVPATVQPGAPMSAPVAAAAERLATQLADALWARAGREPEEAL